MKNQIDNPQTLTNRPTQDIEKNPLAILEAKILKAKTNVETHSKYFTDNEAAIAKLQEENESLKETILLNQGQYERMTEKKEAIVNVAQLLKGLGEEAKIAIELAGHDPGPNPEPTVQEAGQTEEVQKDSGSTDDTSTFTSGEADGESGSGDSNGSAIAETEKKPETEQPSAGQQSEGSPVAVEPSYRENGLILLDTTKAETTKKCNGYTVTFQEAKDYKLNKKDYTGITLKLVGQGTTSLGREVHCGFESGSSEYFIVCKDATGKQYKDSTKSKREAMPREFAAIRQAAIMWMSCNFPLTASKWEGQVVYATPSPAKPTDKQAANVAATPSK